MNIFLERFSYFNYFNYSLIFHKFSSLNVLYIICSNVFLKHRLMNSSYKKNYSSSFHQKKIFLWQRIKRGRWYLRRYSVPNLCHVPETLTCDWLIFYNTWIWLVDAIRFKYSNLQNGAFFWAMWQRLLCITRFFYLQVLALGGFLSKIPLAG